MYYKFKQSDIEFEILGAGEDLTKIKYRYRKDIYTLSTKDLETASDWKSSIKPAEESCSAEKPDLDTGFACLYWDVVPANIFSISTTPRGLCPTRFGPNPTKSYEEMLQGMLSTWLKHVVPRSSIPKIKVYEEGIDKLVLEWIIETIKDWNEPDIKANIAIL